LLALFLICLRFDVEPSKPGANVAEMIPRLKFLTIKIRELHGFFKSASVHLKPNSWMLKALNWHSISSSVIWP
jgi:hypothetical protein